MFTSVILGAGKSTRMKANKSKLLFNIAGQPVINHILSSLKDAKASLRCLRTFVEFKAISLLLNFFLVLVTSRIKKYKTVNPPAAIRDAEESKYKSIAEMENKIITELNN